MKRILMITTFAIAVLTIPAPTSATRVHPAISAPALVPPPLCPPICH